MFRMLNKNVHYTEDDYKKMSGFVINQWLSGSPSTAHISKLLNKNISINGEDPLPMRVRVKIIRELAPVNISIKYPKANKVKNEYIEYISKYYNINLELAKRYLSIMSDEQANEIKNEVKYMKKRGLI